MSRTRLAKRLREQARSIGDLTAEIGCAPGSAQRLVGGRYRPSVTIALQIARWLRCDVEDVFADVTDAKC